MSKNTKEQEIPYSYLVDNIKIFLIFLVVFNHIIAFQLVKADQVVRFVWYGITIFHMPAFIFISGYLSKKPQDVMKNVKNLLIPYILGYTLTWAAQIWLGNKMDYELLRPSGTVMWYVLALFAYRLTIEAFGKIRFIVPLSIIFALWAGTRMEFSTFLSASRIVVFFPFFVAGYLWKSEYTKVIRKFKGKIVVALFVIILLFVATNYMIGNNIPVDLFRGNHSYLASGMDNVEGMVVRGMMYLISFTVIFALLVLMPDKRHPFIFLGRNTMGIYFFHYPIMILMNGLMILNIPQLMNVWALFGVSLLFVLILGSLPVDWIYTNIMKRKTGSQYWHSVEWLLKSWPLHGIHRLIQKRKRSMKKDSPEGLSFFVSERDYCEQKFCSYFFTGRCSFIMTYYANCVILNVFSDCCLQNIQEKLMQNLLVNEWWIANSNFFAVILTRAWETR